VSVAEMPCKDLAFELLLESAIGSSNKWGHMGTVSVAVKGAKDASDLIVAGRNAHYHQQRKLPNCIASS